MSENLAARARQCNLDAWRAVAKATGRDLIDADGMLTYFSMAPRRNFNPTVVYEPLDDPGALLHGRRAEYEARGLPFGFEIPTGVDPATEAAALDAGLSLAGEQPAMVLHPIGELPPPDPRVRRVTPDDLDDHIRTAADGFGDDLEALRIFTRPEMLDVSAMFTAYVDGVPAATALSCVTGKDAGVFGVATLPDYRRRGLGAAATIEAIRAAANAGAELAFLHASEMGLPVYARLGFVVVDTQRIYAQPDG